MPAANFYGKRKPRVDENKPKSTYTGFQKGVSGNPAGRPPGPSKTTLEAKAFCSMIVDSEEYQASVHERAMRGELAPAMETMLWHYAKGKPTERIEMVVSQARLEELAKSEPEKFTTLGEQVRAAVALLAEVNKP
jgi:hypothetical protein